MIIKPWGSINGGFLLSWYLFVGIQCPSLFNGRGIIRFLKLIIGIRFHNISHKLYFYNFNYKYLSNLNFYLIIIQIRYTQGRILWIWKSTKLRIVLWPTSAAPPVRSWACLPARTQCCPRDQDVWSVAGSEHFIRVSLCQVVVCKNFVRTLPIFFRLNTNLFCFATTL